MTITIYLALCSHLYFVNDSCIYRSHLDGLGLEVVVDGDELNLRLSSDYHGLAVDEETNVLYWTDTTANPMKSSIRSISIKDFENRSSTFVS